MKNPMPMPSVLPGLEVIATHDFPNGVIRSYADGTHREFPKWCPLISVPRDDEYVATALAQLAQYRSSQAAAAAAEQAAAELTQIDDGDQPAANRPSER